VPHLYSTNLELNARICALLAKYSSICTAMTVDMIIYKGLHKKYNTMKQRFFQRNCCVHPAAFVLFK
jgi:hypothetical protein